MAQLDSALAEFPDRSTLDRVLALVVAVLLTVVILASVAATLYVAHETTQIRQAQIENTRVATCQNKAFAAVLFDIGLAFKNDKTAADYLTSPPKC